MAEGGMDIRRMLARADDFDAMDGDPLDGAFGDMPGGMSDGFDAPDGRLARFRPANRGCVSPARSSRTLGAQV
jgi:hypothetical protein